MDPIALAQAGPVAILLVFISAMVVGFVRGTVVPGWLYQQERAQRTKAETQAERNSESLALISQAAADAHAALAERQAAARATGASRHA